MGKIYYNGSVYDDKDWDYPNKRPKADAVPITEEQINQEHSIIVEVSTEELE